MIYKNDTFSLTVKIFKNKKTGEMMDLTGTSIYAIVNGDFTKKIDGTVDPNQTEGSPTRGLAYIPVTGDQYGIADAEGKIKLEIVWNGRTVFRNAEFVINPSDKS